MIRKAGITSMSSMCCTMWALKRYSSESVCRGPFREKKIRATAPRKLAFRQRARRLGKPLVLLPGRPHCEQIDGGQVHDSDEYGYVYFEARRVSGPDGDPELMVPPTYPI